MGKADSEFRNKYDDKEIIIMTFGLIKGDKRNNNFYILYADKKTIESFVANPLYILTL